MKKKKLCCMLLMLGMAVGLAACGKTEESAEQTSSETKAEVSETSTPAPEKEQETDIVQEAQVLSLDKQIYEKWDWYGTELTVWQKWSNVSLQGEDTATAKLQDVLESANFEYTADNEDSFDNSVAYVNSQIPDGADSEDFSEWAGELVPRISYENTYVRRADSVVLSTMTDRLQTVGYTLDYRAIWTANYDTQTGTLLSLSDVVKDVDGFKEQVVKRLGYQLEGDGLIEKYFEEMDEKYISWTLDYEGVTVWFSGGDITSSGEDIQSVTVDFESSPELFVAKYMVVPDAYMYELPLTNTYFHEKPRTEGIHVIGVCDDIYTGFSEYKLQIVTQDDEYGMESVWYADDILPYFVKTADGKKYVYVFLKYAEGEQPTYSLEVYDVTEPEFTYVDGMQVGPALTDGVDEYNWIGNSYELLTDPGNMHLYDYENTQLMHFYFCVGEDGMPEWFDNGLESGVIDSDFGDEEGGWASEFDPDKLKEYSVTAEDFDDTAWSDQVIVNPEMGEPIFYPYEGTGESPGISIEFNGNHEGYFEKDGVGTDMKYYMVEGNVLSIQPEGSEDVILLFYYAESAEGRGWLRLDTDDDIIYLR